MPSQPNLPFAFCLLPFAMQRRSSKLPSPVFPFCSVLTLRQNRLPPTKDNGLAVNRGKT